MSSKRYWFTAKIKGMGWCPLCAEGWLVLAAYLILSVLPFLVLGPELLARVMFLYLLYIAVLSALLLLVIYQKGER